MIRSAPIWFVTTLVFLLGPSAAAAQTTLGTRQQRRSSRNALVAPADARRHPAWRVRPLSRQQRPSLLRPRRPDRPGEEVDQRQEQHPLPHAEGRHPHPDRPLRQSRDREDPDEPDAAHVRARAERRVRRFPRAAPCRARLHDRRALFRHAARDRALRRVLVRYRPDRQAVDHHRVRRTGREHLVAEQGSVARRA